MMNRYAARTRNMWKVRAIALAIFSLGLGSSSLVAANLPSTVVSLEKTDKESADKLITNVKASYNPVV